MVRPPCSAAPGGGMCEAAMSQLRGCVS
jgi:hypothetical protein